MKIAVAGTGYVGLVTGVTFAEIGHDVTCVDIDKEKVEKMRKGISPIYEQGLEELMNKNKDRLIYTTDYKSAYKDAEAIFIGVGTPEKEDGSANLEYVFKVCDQIAESVNKDTVVVVKSTVPIGTNDEVEAYLNSKVKKDIKIDVASNPEFLAQGTAVRDTLYAARIVVGTETERAKRIMEDIYYAFSQEPYNIPYLATNRRSAEMIKYASNDFLALKICYVNEMANLCEKLGANMADVAKGMGYDSRIGNKFLNFGVGYGGSCFPKDTKALYNLAKEYGVELRTVKSAIEINKEQKLKLFNKAMEDNKHNLKGKSIAILGATFKPGTDDLREAPSIDTINLLLEQGAEITVYDPVGLDNMKKVFNDQINYTDSIEEAIMNKDMAFIMTEWPDILEFNIGKYEELMKTPSIYDGRCCYDLDDISNTEIIYYSIGRTPDMKEPITV